MIISTRLKERDRHLFETEKERDGRVGRLTKHGKDMARKEGKNRSEL